MACFAFVPDRNKARATDIFLNQHALSSAMKLYGDFKERGYEIQAFIPSEEEDPLAFLVKATKDGKPVKEMTIPLMHPVTFGVDHEDHDNLEAQMDEFMSGLP